jgi:hypothetical protein
MAKKPPPKPPSKPRPKNTGKETITPPKTKLVSTEAKKLRSGDRAAGRIMAEESVAVREGVRKSSKSRPKPKK